MRYYEVVAKRVVPLCLVVRGFVLLEVKWEFQKNSMVLHKVVCLDCNLSDQQVLYVTDARKLCQLHGCQWVVNKKKKNSVLFIVSLIWKHNFTRLSNKFPSTIFFSQNVWKSPSQTHFQLKTEKSSHFLCTFAWNTLSSP